MCPLLEVESKVMGGGVVGIQPHFSPWGKIGKKVMEREGKVFISLSFHILFSPFFRWEKMGKHTFFHGQKWGWTPPPQVIGHCNKNSATTQLLLKNHYRISRI